MAKATKKGKAMETAGAVLKENSITEILQHRISWYLSGNDAPADLDEASVEHIERLIKEGYNQGELCVSIGETGQEFRGWWHIETEADRERQRA